MTFKVEEEVKYHGHKAVVKGIIPAFFQVGYFPDGTEDIDICYIEQGFDMGRHEFDTVLLEVDDRLIRVSPNALEKIEQKEDKPKEAKETKKGEKVING